MPRYLGFAGRYLVPPLLSILSIGATSQTLPSGPSSCFQISTPADGSEVAGPIVILVAEVVPPVCSFSTPPTPDEVDAVSFEYSIDGSSWTVIEKNPYLGGGTLTQSLFAWAVTWDTTGRSLGFYRLRDRFFLSNGNVIDTNDTDPITITLLGYTGAVDKTDAPPPSPEPVGCVPKTIELRGENGKRVTALGPEGDMKKPWPAVQVMVYKEENGKEIPTKVGIDGMTLGPLSMNSLNLEVNRGRLYVGFAFEILTTVEGDPAMCRTNQILGTANKTYLTFKADGMRFNDEGRKKICESCAGQA